MTSDVRTALAFVARGEAALGIVYATDAAAEPAVKIVATFPDDSHPPILYPFALTAASAQPGGGELFRLSEVRGGPRVLRPPGLRRHPVKPAAARGI